jgi:hypothetical protein
MTARPFHVLVLASFLLAPVLAEAQGAVKLPVPIPDGTMVSPIKYGEQETTAELKPAEQVAFLFVNAIWGSEEKSLDKDSGLGRLCTLGELIKGMKTPGGQTIGLAVSPVRDTNYRYEIQIIGGYCVIKALPRVRGLGAFAMVGSPRGFGGNGFYYDPVGPELVQAEKVTEFGYAGDGFRR